MLNKIVISFLSVVVSALFSFTFSQNSGKIQGVVIDQNTQETVIGASVTVQNSTQKTITDINGEFVLELPVGTYNIDVTAELYTKQSKYNLVVTSGNTQIIKFELTEANTEIDAIVITDKKEVKATATDMVTPLSVQRLTSEEIKSNPGGNYDVSKVVQTLPGVGGSGGGAARNDIIIRGGAPNENVYYLDGIEVPVLNHFQTQGSSGGAQGIINVAFIDELKLTSSAFDARYDNALASTFVVKQRQGNTKKYEGNIRSSFTESAFALEGPLGKKTDFLAAGRISYLDFLFKLIDLPIRPRYQDYQLNTTTKLNDKTTLKFIGIGAIDNFSFGATREASPENEYLRRSLPIISQWTYTNGIVLKRLIERGYINVALSRNMFNNEIDRFTDAQYDNEAFRNFGLKSQEIENKLRVDVNRYKNGWKYAYGISAQYVKYNADLYNKLSDNQTDSLGNVIVPGITITAKSAIDFARFGAFGQVSKRFAKDKLLISAGVRTDMNTFTDDGMNPLSTLSPRLSTAYTLNSKWEVSASVGSYYKLPTYTVLGYADASGTLQNKDVKYIQSTHYVTGVQFLPNEALRFTLEGFYKSYNNYPVSVVNGISLANQGQEFGAVGNEEVESNGKGETFGIEIFAQQKLTKKIFYFVSYTYVRSLFSGKDGKKVASAWDNQHLLSATIGYKLGKNWQLGLKYRLAGGTPYTPFDTIASRQNYALLGAGVLDYTKLNSERLNTFSQLDLRIDKTWNFKKTSMIFFIDIQNLLLNKQESAPYYTFKRKADNSGFETTDGLALKSDGSNGIPVLLPNNSATVTPTIGLIFQF
ncbi:MAG: TonB-dependent receptor [Fluviicola sp.]